MSKGGSHPLLFPLAVAVRDPATTEIFEYLWNRFDYVWDYKHLQQALLMVINCERIDLLLFILRSRTTQSLWLSFSFHFRI
jgi:hypothetical protein